MRLALIAALFGLGACRDRGVIDIEVTLPAECAAPTHVAVYLMRGAVCGDCACGDCLLPCDGERCTLGCGGDFCPFDDFLAGGVEVVPDEPGSYAVVYQFVTIDADGRVEEVAASCVDEVQLDKDGTEDVRLAVEAVCCVD